MISQIERTNSDVARQTMMAVAPSVSCVEQKWSGILDILF